MVEARKREMSQQAGLEEEPPRKIRRIVPERIGKIIDVTGDDDPGCTDDNKNHARSRSIRSTGSGGGRAGVQGG